MKLRGELLEQLAGAYALGSLQGGARRRMETLARQQPEVREAISRWQHQLASLTELVPPVQPPEAVWKRIDGVLQADMALRAKGPSPAAPASPSASAGGAPSRSLGLGWLAGVLGLGLAAAIGWGWQQQGALQQESGRFREQLALQTGLLDQARGELQRVNRIGYVAVLGDAKAGPSLLVTFDPSSRQLAVKRVGSYQEAAEKSLQLWTIAPGQAPKSLGVLGREARERLQAEAPDVAEQRVLAISLEPLGGVPSERGPTGPVLFTGPVLKTDA